MKIIRSDNGLEFLSRPMKQFYQQKGIVHQTTCIDTPQQNGRVERKHRHILNVARALRFQAHLPINFWGESVLTAAYLINRTPSKVLNGKTPYELLFNTKPSYDNIKMFGCLFYAHSKSRTKDKFAPRSRKCIFVGYPHGTKGWKVYDLETNEIFISRDVIFHETIFPFSTHNIGKCEKEILLGNNNTINENCLRDCGYHEVENGEHRGNGLIEEKDLPPEIGLPECEVHENTSPLEKTGPFAPRDESESILSRRTDLAVIGPHTYADPGLFSQYGVSMLPVHGFDASQTSALESMVGTGLKTAELDRPVDRGSAENPDGQLNVNHRPTRMKRAPSHLEDYFCYTSQVNDPSLASLPANSSSGNPYPLVNYITCNNFSASHRAFLATITKIVDPRYYQEAVKDSRWRHAMAEEIRASEENKTWTIEELPPGKKPISCKWVYRVKYRSDGTIERFKARLVVRGDHQLEGFDFTETFAPVAKMYSVRTFLSVAVARGREIHQMDVNNAFPHGDLEEEVYMKLPPGFSSSSPTKVCKLRKSLYGLRQAPRQWFAKLSSTLIAYGFVRSYADYSLFTFRKGEVFLAVLVYVDDIILAGNDSHACAEFKTHLNACFRIKDLGALKYFLGIEVARGPTDLFLRQRKYALEIVEESGLLGSKPTDFPMAENHNLALAKGRRLADPSQYRRLVGRLIYLTITRPDLCYAVHISSQFIQEPLEEHMHAARRLLRYIKGTSGYGILMRSDCDLQIRAYCDADWGACPLTRRSLTGYLVTIDGSPISWKTKKQTTVSRSSAEAEYRSMAATTSELMWLKAFLASLGVFHESAMHLFCDNQAALHIAKNPVFHERTKHIELDCQFVREKLEAGDLTFSYISSNQQPADIFTKALGRKQFTYLRDKLGMVNPQAPT